MKTQTKKSRILFSLLTTFLFCVTTPAQRQPHLVCIAESEVTTATAQIAVQIPDNSPITKIRLNSENSGKSLVKEVSAGKSFFLPVELADEENYFNIIAYANNKIIYSTEDPITIFRTKSSSTAELPIEEPLTPLISKFSAGEGAESGAKAANGGQINLLGKGKIKNQATYNLEIDASELPPIVGNYAIEILNENKGVKTFDSETRKIEFDAGINRHKQLQSVELNLREGKNTIVITPRGERLGFVKSAKIVVECNNCQNQPAPNDSVIVRSIIGLEQVGASSARSEQRPFLSFFFNTPINAGTKMVCPKDLTGNRMKTCFEEQKTEKPKFTFSVWGDVRLTTTPVQSIGSLASFTPAAFASNFVQGDSAGKVNDLVRSFDFLVGFDKQIFGSDKVFDGVLPGKTSLSFIMAGGAISPLSSDRTALFFKIPTERTSQNSVNFFNAFDQIVEGSPYKNIAFVAPERDRFFRQYYAGFRLKTLFDNKDVKFQPALFDVTFGQNEAITGILKGVIMRLDGSTPLPVSKAGFLYLFGSVNMRLGRNRETSPTFFLEPTTGVSLTAADTIVFPIDRLPFQTKDRDVFRIGVGVDVFKLFKKDEAPK